MSSKINHLYEFEDFRLDAENPALWRGGELVSISPKALQTLILLVGKNGGIVSREDLMDTVWKDTFVEEGNINYTISLLRKKLENKNLIETVPRRGYRFAGEVREITENGNGKNRIEVSPPDKIIEKKSPVRWVFISVCLIGIFFLTSFALLRRGENPPKPSENPAAANADALQAYTNGKMILAKKTVENRVEKAIDEFQKAATFDPTFAPAYAGLAEGYSSAAVKTSGKQSRENYAKAKAAAEKSLALDANLAEGYLIRGWLKRQADWDWAGAENDFRRAIQLDPKNASAHHRLSQLLTTLGRHDEALTEFNTAYELDPIADYIVGARFPLLEARREYGEALKQAEQFLRENKGNNSAARAYATFLYHTGNYAKVIELGEQTPTKDAAQNSFAWLSLLGASYQKTGEFEKASEKLKQLESLAEADTKALYSLAMNYAELGRADEALMNLEKCFDQHEERMVWINVEPRFENLRNDVRFQDLLQRMKLI